MDKKEIMVFRPKGKALVVGPINMSRNFMLMALILESLRFTWNGKIKKRKPFLDKLMRFLNDEPQKLSKLRSLLKVNSVIIEPDNNGNYLFYVEIGRYSGKTRSLINEINGSLKDPDFQDFIDKLLTVLKGEVGQKVVKGISTRLVLAYGDASLARIRYNPTDKMHKGLEQCLDKIASPYICQEIERALIGPESMEAS